MNGADRQNPDRRGRGAADAAPALQSRIRRLPRRCRGARRRGRYQAEGKRAGSDRARLDAARAVPASNCAAGCGRGRKTKSLPIIMLDRARRGKRAPARPLDRRGRLYRQAVFRCRNCWRAVRALLRRAKPEQRRRCAHHRRDRTRPGQETRVAQRARYRIGADGIPACWNS